MNNELSSTDVIFQSAIRKTVDGEWITIGHVDSTYLKANG